MILRFFFQEINQKGTSKLTLNAESIRRGFIRVKMCNKWCPIMTPHNMNSPLTSAGKMILCFYPRYFYYGWLLKTSPFLLQTNVKWFNMWEGYTSSENALELFHTLKWDCIHKVNLPCPMSTLLPGNRRITWEGEY